MLLIDLSNNNPSVVWPALDHFGIVGGFLKASQGIDFVDGTYAQRRKQAQAAGIPTGAYHFAEATHPAADEAALFCRVVGQVHAGELRPVLDLERAGNHPGAPTLAAWARQFNAEVVKRLGVGPIFYSYSSFVTDTLKPREPIGYGLWLASYGRDDGTEHPFQVPAPWRHAVAHQFANDASVPGVEGKCDLSSCRSLAALRAYRV